MSLMNIFSFIHHQFMLPAQTRAFSFDSSPLLISSSRVFTFDSSSFISSSPLRFITALTNVKETVSSLATSSLLYYEASRFPMRQSIDPLQASTLLQFLPCCLTQLAQAEWILCLSVFFLLCFLFFVLFIFTLRKNLIFQRMKDLYLVALTFFPLLAAALDCYSFCFFCVELKASRAIELKNHSLLYGKVIRVMWSRRDPDVRKSGRGNVFVKNLAESIDNAGLHDLFQKFGNILSSKVVMSEDGKSKGYGFVQFESEESANAAIEKLNGITVKDKQIYVGNFVKKSERILPDPEAKYTNIYIKNLDSDITEELLQKKFSSFGKIMSLAIAKDANGMSKGFAFVNYDNPEEAKQAMEAMNGSQFGSKILYVARAQKKAEREQILHHLFEEKRKEHILKYKGSNIYVKNINDSVTDDQLREHFSACGTITSAKVMQDEKGVSKGFGFVCFSTPEEAHKAVNTFHGCMFHGKPLYVALAQRKEDRQTQLQLYFSQQLPGLGAPSNAVIPGGYPRFYYTGGVLSHVPSQPGMMYQHLGSRSGWRANNAFAPPTRSFQQSAAPNVSNNTKQHRQNRGRMNGHTNSHGKAYSSQSAASSKDSSAQQSGQAIFVLGGHRNVMEKGSGISSSGGSQGSEMLHSMLATAVPEQQKQILGERLFPLIKKLKPNLASKITGMLLEMDNAELLLLLESPESLSAKVEEAVQVLKNSTTKVSGQEAFHPNLLSAEVTVN